MLNFKNYLFAFLIICMACQNTKAPKNQESIKSLKYLALGDSYTIGESVRESERWPNQLADSLNKKGINILKPKIIAKTGWTTDELMNAIQDSIITHDYDLVSLLIGVNNQYRAYPLANYKVELNGLLDKAIQYAGDDPSKVFVVSIPDWGVTPFAEGRNSTQIAEEIDMFNNVCREACETKNIIFIDITDSSRKVDLDPGLIAADGLHPSAKMYAKWVERIIPRMLTMIDNK